MLLIHRAERADALVSALADVLRVPGGDPFASEIVAVPSRGVERWLAQQLSGVLGAADGDGVCANVLFPSYTELLDRSAADAHAGYADSVECWSAERSVWPLLRVIDRSAPSEPWCRVLAVHLGLDGTREPNVGRRFSVAAKLARFFAGYGRARPEMLRAWADGRDEDGAGAPVSEDLSWQPELWRRLRAEIGVPAPAELLEAVCPAIPSGPSFSIFGPTRISPARIRILTAIAATRDVHLWLYHPSPALWSAVAAAGERPSRRAAQLPVVAHPLLASLSRDVRELQQLLAELPREDVHHPLPARPSSLLGRLQTQLAEDDVPTDRIALAADDRSIQIHAAHGPARQVEVVREVVLGLLADDATLEPRDILIMCPDVESFAPLIAASFGMAEDPDGHPAAKLRVRIADRSLRQTNPLLSLLVQVLDLAASRVTATQVLDIAGARPVRRLFGFDDDDIERLRDWTVSAGARWGLDAAHRDTYRLGGIAQGTWRTAVDRMLLGVAMEDDGNWLGDTLPLDDVDSADIELAGRFAELVDRLDTAVRTLDQARPISAWARVLDEMVRNLGTAEHAWQSIQLGRELHDLAELAGDDADVELSLADISALVRDRLAGRPTRASFRTGTLTVCTLVPMRSVPHRVVCLVGMDDGAFPRQAIPDGDDVLARDPRSGERDPRSEDRQLFLDAICAAQEHLVVTYTGADPRSGAPVPPCVPLGELMDAIDATALAPDGDAVLTHVVTSHPLQPFDQRNFVPGRLGVDRPFSYDRVAVAGARAATGRRSAPARLVTAPLAAATADTVQLDELVAFFQHPVRGFLRQRLGIATSSRDEDPDDALTIELEPLQGWAIGDRVLRSCLAGLSRSDAARLEYLRGELPPGRLGSDQLRIIGARIDALLAACEVERQHEPSALDVAVQLSDGRTLTGTVGGVRGSAVLEVTYSTLKPKQRFAAWLRYLALLATTGRSDLRGVTVGRLRDDARRSIVSGLQAPLAVQVLDLLVGIRDRGLREPLPLALDTSADYATRRHRGSTIEDSLPSACRTWEAGNFPEHADREHVLVYGPSASFDVLTAQVAGGDDSYPGEPTRFGALARLVWEPLLTVETDVLP